MLAGDFVLLDTLLPDQADPEGPFAVDEYGWSVAVSDDYRVVETPYSSLTPTTPLAGAVYVYDSRDELIATINNPTPAIFELFGNSVAISGDLVVVGSPGDQPEMSLIAAGRAYVYDLSSGSPVLLDAIDNPTPNTNDLFGFSVSISGKIVVVGAARRGRRGRRSFQRDGHSLHLRRFKRQRGPGGRHRRGSRRWFQRPGWRRGGSRRRFPCGGALGGETVYVYDISSGGAELFDTIANPVPSVSYEFGSTLAVSGHTVVIGATGGESAFVYDISGDQAELLDTLSNPTPAAADRFGKSVAVSGDLVLVGADGDDTLASGAGSAYLFDISSGAGMLVATLNNPTPDASDSFGYSVAIFRDKLLVGSPQDDAAGADVGAAHLFVESIFEDFLPRILPGSLAYEQQAEFAIEDSQTRSTAVEIDAAQTLAVVAEPGEETLDVAVVVWNEAKEVVADVDAVGPGGAEIVQAMTLPPGKYTVETTSTSGAGSFTLTMTLGAAIEEEPYGGAADDTQETGKISTGRLFRWRAARPIGRPWRAMVPTRPTTGIMSPSRTTSRPRSR